VALLGAPGCQPKEGSPAAGAGSTASSAGSTDDEEASTSGSGSTGDAMCPDGYVHDADLVITDATTAEEVACIREVTGSLRVEQTPLVALGILTVLETVRGDVWLGENGSLVSLDGLENLHEIRGRLFVDHNVALVDMSAIGGLVHLGGMEITRNPELVELPPLIGEVEVGFGFDVAYNHSLTDLDAFSELVPIPLIASGVAFTISFENELASAAGLSSFAGLGEGFTLHATRAPSLAELPQLGPEIGELHLRDLPALSSLEPLTTLETARELHLANLGAQDLAGLDSVKTILGSLIIGDCNPALDQGDALQSLAGLDGLSAAAAVYIVGNAELSDVSALLGLQDAGDSLFITDNPELPPAQAQALADAVPDTEATLCGNQGEPPCEKCYPQGE
jgi:hypothetical protein